MLLGLSVSSSLSLSLAVFLWKSILKGSCLGKPSFVHDLILEMWVLILRNWWESLQRNICLLPPDDTSLIWATPSQRNLWHLKMTKIVTNLWSPKNTWSCRHWVQIWGLDTAKILFQISRYWVQTKDRRLLLFLLLLNISEAVWQEIGESEMEETRPPL